MASIYDIAENNKFDKEISNFFNNTIAENVVSDFTSKLLPNFLTNSSNTIAENIASNFTSNLLPDFLTNSVCAEGINSGIFSLLDPMKSILSVNAIQKLNIAQIAPAIELYKLPSLAILNTLNGSYDDIIVRQIKAFEQIDNFPLPERKLLLHHEKKQKEAISLDSEDLENADVINHNVTSTINLVNSRANVDTQHIDSSELAEKIDFELFELLQSHGKEYIDILKGAKQAATSNNSDKVRHTVVSLRELLNKILNELAPVDKVKQWVCGNGGENKGNPTRGIHIEYIFRNISCSSIAPLIENEINFIPKLIKILSDETHGLLSGYSDKELNLLIDKTTSTLLMLLRYSQTK
jgi:hypothetical protein